ncbi:hypothetical protein BHE74_00002319 [Ensete ventricosum]|nr:hypothetical protein BHE74_00002319 [Ensete ventricosum]
MSPCNAGHGFFDLAVSLDEASGGLFGIAWDALPSQIGLLWMWVRGRVVVPLVRIAVVLCLVMSIILLIEKVSMGLVSLYVKVFRRKPEKIYKWEPIQADEELGSSAYPMVLVQVPMFNEREVYKLSVGAVCSLAWPPDRLIVQVLDDSTDLAIRDMVRGECEKWIRKGITVHYISRDNRNGYKAGAMKEAMEMDYVRQCDYVAIFDADFQPASDFLVRTVPFLMHNPEIALVQARWKFGKHVPTSSNLNADECLMTKIQEMSLNYHFKVEQQAGSSTIEFFGFNGESQLPKQTVCQKHHPDLASNTGTAGVWRISAMVAVEGWKERTTVEDMDLAVRASLAGWKFLYVGGVKVKNELPSTFKAYRFQQHRWSCGPANLFKKMAVEIITAKKVSMVKRFFMLYNFFFARRVIAHNVTFFFYCMIIPLSCFFPEIQIPNWGVIYIPTAITLLSAVATPRFGLSSPRRPFLDLGTAVDVCSPSVSDPFT